MSPDKTPPTTARLKIAGAWTGIIDVRLDHWTVQMLREDVARRSGGSPDSIKLISGGKILKDEDGSLPLQQLGLKHNSKVLASATSPDQVKSVIDQEDRESKLSRIRAAAYALAQRHADGSLPVEGFNLELENQNGQKVNFGSENDQRAVMMGLMLHENAKSLIKKQKFKEALDVLSIAEEAFSLCDPKIIEMIDNVPILQLDTVWCYFSLRDISCLSMAGMRLAKSREGFQRSHGRDNSRFRLLQAGRPAELALYLRLELLEGVVAFYSGNQVESYKALSAAKSKLDQLQVADEALSLLMSMGYRQKEAKRALRMCGQDIQRAVEFLVDELAKKTRRHLENIQRKNEIKEQKKYGLTPSNKSVNIQSLNDLASMGFERYLAAEALRVNDNDTQQALDLLTDLDKNCALQQKIDSRKRTRQQRQTAVVTAPIQIAHSGDNATTSSVILDLEGESHELDDKDLASSPPKEDRDKEMEDELAKELTGDAYEDYDFEVSKEGEAIAEYLALLESTSS